MEPTTLGIIISVVLVLAAAGGAFFLLRLRKAITAIHRGLQDLSDQVVRLQESLPKPERHGEENTITILDYYPINATPRYGYGVPVASWMVELLQRDLEEYRATLESFVTFLPQLLEIPRLPNPESPEQPAWLNGYLPGLDTISLFGMISTRRPGLFLEIGSGHSTKIAARAKALNNPQMRIISIDPNPRVEIDGLCDRVVRFPLDAVAQEIFDQLVPGDFLFLDGSHRVLQNSDVTIFFNEILPRIKSGVYIHLHDIFWPYDYPLELKDHYYSEQYMLALLLRFAANQFKIVLPNTFISWHTGFYRIFDQVWESPALEGVHKHGSSFWLYKL